MAAETDTDSPLDKSARPKGARLALLLAGLAGVPFGTAVLLWPTKTAVPLTGVIAVYAIAGIFYVGIGFIGKALGGGGRMSV